MENIFFSGTFGGELLSLAAAKAVLELHSSRDIAGELTLIGDKIANGVNKSIDSFNLDGAIQISGHPSWKFLNWHEFQGVKANVLKTYFMQEMFARGILVLGTHNVNLALNEKNVKVILNAYNEVLGKMSNLINAGNLENHLKVKPLEPLFKIR